MFRRSPPPPPPPQQQYQQRHRSPSPPPPPPPPPPHSAAMSAGLGATTLGKQSQPGLGSGAALAALASLKMGLSGLVGGSTPASSHGASAAGATHVRKHSRRQASRDLKELKLSSKAAKAAEKAHSKRIDAMLAEQEAAEKAIVKILLLGPGESGKSTLFKQIQKNYGSGFDASERKKHHLIVVQNVVRSIKSLLYHSDRLLQRLPFSALANSAKAASTTVSAELAESRAYVENVNLYKLFEGTGLALEQTAPGDAPPSPEISPTNSRSGSTASSASSSISRSASLTNAHAAGGGRGGQHFFPAGQTISNTDSLITMSPASQMYGGHSLSSVKLNPSGRFVPQILTKGADGRSAQDIFHEILTHCFLLWSDPGLKCTFENRAHFDFHQLFDSDSYFLHKLSTGALLQADYVPSDEDLIRVRIRTTAINTVDFKMKADEEARNSALIPMRLLDVAGQRSERKKWIPYFQDATAVIFVAAISEYDQVLAEDGRTNRVLESINLFTEIMNSSWFARTPLVLFLNKCDLFAEKLRRVPLNVLFPKYAGSASYQHACEFLCREFVKRRANPNKVIHIHVVSAIQIDLIKTAMDSVKTMIVEQSLGMAGLMT